MEQFEQAIAAQKEALLLNPDSLIAQICLAACAGHSGREPEAQAAAAQILRLSPNFSLEAWGQSLPRKDPKVLQHMISGLREAGLK